MERIVNTMEENFKRDDIMKIWNDYTIKDAIFDIEKAMKAIKPKTVNCCGTKPCLDVVHDFTGFMTERIKEIMNLISWVCGYGKKKWG